MEPDSGELFFYLFGGPCGHNFRRVQTACRNSLSGNIMSRNRFRDLSITRSNYVCMCMYFIRQRTIQQRHCKNSSRQDSQTVSQNYHYFPVFFEGGQPCWAACPGSPPYFSFVYLCNCAIGQYSDGSIDTPVILHLFFWLTPCRVPTRIAQRTEHRHQTVVQQSSADQSSNCR